MTLARFSLIATAIAFLFFGFWLLIQPEGLAILGVQLPTESAKIEIRAMYGGLEIGIGIFFLLSAFRPAWYAAALMLQTMSLGALGLTRLIATILADAPHQLLFVFCALELFAALIGFIAYRRLPRQVL